MAANNVTLDSEFPLQDILKIFNGDQFYVKLFKNLLVAATTGDYSAISRTPKEIMYLYLQMRAKIEKFVMDDIYESIYTSAAYDGLITSLIDIYAVMYTVIYLRANINDISIQPDEVVDNYLDAFGFKAKHLFNYIQRREICKVVYWYLRRKGTPSLIIKLLDMLGFTYFYLCEFQIYEIKEQSGIGSNSGFDKHIYKSKLLYEELPKNDSIGFFTGLEYPYSWIRDEDPLCILTDENLSANKNTTYPLQSPYYQVGVSVTHADLEKQIAAFTYAMIKKTLIDMDLGEDVFKSKVENYNGRKVSFISLILGWTYLLGEYFGITDNYLYEEISYKEAYDIIGTKYDMSGKKYDQGDISRRDLLYDPGHTFKSANIYDNKPSIIYDTNDAKYDRKINKNNIVTEGDSAYRLKYPVFGWQKDIKNSTPLDIMYDIDREIKRLNKRLLWQPNDSEIRLNNHPTNTIIRERNTIKDRKEKALKEIYEIFYGAPIFGTYKKAIKYFEEHDPNFKEYLDSKMLTKEERMNLAKDERFEDIEDNFQKILEVMDNILEAIEYYIFDNTTFMIPVRNLVLSYEKIIRILNELDKYYTPYHAKLLDPMVVWIIRDLPGDCIAIDDTKYESSTRTSIRDVVWRTSHYSMDDIAPPDPYVPINDWECNNPNMPHIPISPNYLDDPYYNREEWQKLNKILYSIGYDWRNLDTKPFIVRSECLKPIYDWDPDIVSVNIEYKCTSAFNTVKPDHDRIKKLKELEEEQLKKTCYVDSYVYTIVGDGTTARYEISHDLYNRDTIVQCYDVATGCDVTPSIKRTSMDTIEVEFNDVLPKDVKITVIIIARMRKNVPIFNHITSKMVNIIGNGRLKNFLVYHNLDTDNIIIEVYDRLMGEMVGVGTRRINNKMCYISFNIPPNKDRTYRANIIAPLDKSNPSYVTYYTFEFSKDITGDDTTYNFKIDHNFNSNNIVTQVYDDITGETVDCIVDHINPNQLEIEFKNPIGFRRYRAVIIGSLNKNVGTSTPMNNLTGFSTTITCNGIIKDFLLRHNLNSIETFVQIRDKSNGQFVKCGIVNKDTNNTIVSFGRAPDKGKEYIVSIVAPLYINRLTKPSSYYNTTMKQMTIIGNGINNRFELKHHINSDPIVLQVFDKNNGQLVDTYEEIIDKDTVLVIFKNAPKLTDEYLVNILSLPNPEIQPSENITTDSLNLVDLYKTTIVGDNSKSNYTITHNIDTNNILVNIFDHDNMESIYADVTIVDSNNVTIQFKDNVVSGKKYTIVVIGALPTTHLIDDFETVDSGSYLPPHHYRELKSYITHPLTIHKSGDHDHLDAIHELITDPDNSNIKYNLHKFDLPSIKERVDIIHEVKKGSAANSGTDLAGFNQNDVLTNDKRWNRESVLDIFPQYPAYKDGLGEPIQPYQP